MSKETKSKDLYGWQILLVACVFYLMDAILGGFVGALFNVTGTITVLIAIVTGIVNVVKKKAPRNKTNIIMSIIATIILLAIMGWLGQNVGN